jgi:septum formation protein
VWFKSLKKDVLSYYVDQCKPFDKAGAYGVQEWIGLVGVERIEGSFYNVMGLPVGRLYEELSRF